MLFLFQFVFYCLNVLDPVFILCLCICVCLVCCFCQFSFHPVLSIGWSLSLFLVPTQNQVLWLILISFYVISSIVRPGDGFKVTSTRLNWTRVAYCMSVTTCNTLYYRSCCCVQVLRALRVVPGCHQAPSGRRVRLQSEDSQQRAHRGLHLQLHPGEPDPQKRSLSKWQVKAGYSNWPVFGF